MNRRKVLITGATGLIGRALVRDLVKRGDHVVALSRDRARAAAALGGAVELHEWADPLSEQPPKEALAGADAVVHLLGEPIAQRWSSSAKRAIRESRVLSTRNLVDALRALPEASRPRVLVSQSAGGYYGPHGSEPLDEDAPAGDDFLAQVVVAWEAEARAAEDIIRVARTRTGVALAAESGALAMMLPFFRAGVGGPVAGGAQYVPWIHLDDVAGALIRILDDAQLEGAVNLAAPGAVSNRDFSKALGRALRRPAVVPVPELGLRVLYGEMAQVVTSGQHLVPARLQRAGYAFAYPELGEALEALLARSGRRIPPNR